MLPNKRLRTDAAHPLRARCESLLFYGSILLYVAMVCYHASAMEDFYITLRVVDNFWQGYGLRWNIDERVQVYTHPLWMLLHLPFYGLWPNGYAITVALGFVCSMTALYLLLRTFDRSKVVLVCLALLPLSMSRSFMEYSTSGFENSLMHVLFVWFAYLLWRAENGIKSTRYFFWLSVITGLSILTRMDTIILYAPVWGLLAWRTRLRWPWRQLFVAQIPLILWLAFSLIYYGNIFPNTKYAKLSTGVSQSYYVEMGWHYFLNLCLLDTVAALAILAGFAVTLYIAVLYYRTKESHLALILAMGLGTFFYALYIIFIGGTYSTGRFWSLTLLNCVWLLLAAGPTLPKAGWQMPVIVLCCLIRVNLPDQYHGSYWCSTCFHGSRWSNYHETLYVRQLLRGEETIPQPRSMDYYQNPLFVGSIGKWCFMLKRHYIAIDFIGIGDALFARLPLSRDFLYNTGSLARAIPQGYRYARHTGNTERMHKDLGVYYSKLRVIISGDVWDPQRLRTLWEFHRGDYDAYLERYITWMRAQKT